MARRSKQASHATGLETSTPPTSLTPTQHIAKYVKGYGNNIFEVSLPSPTEQYPSGTMLVELPSRFHNTIWLKRGGYVLVETEESAGGRETKIAGEIVNVVRDEKAWRKVLGSGWPREFKERRREGDSEDEEESVVGKMPPWSDDEED